MKFLKKLIAFVVVAAVAFGVMYLMQRPKQGEIGETYTTKSGIEFTLNAVEFADAIDGWGGANDDFWKPLDENNCNIGGRYTLEQYALAHGLKPKSDDDRIVYVSYTAKNTAKNDITINDVGEINYDNGYEYTEGQLAYRVSAEGVWKELPNGITIKQLDSEAREFRAYMIVPKEVAESDKPVTYTVFGYEFELR